MAKPHNKFSIILILIVAFLTTGLVVFTTIKTRNSAPIVKTEASVVEGIEPWNENLEILAPDGKAKLVVKNIETEEGLINQSFSISVGDLSPLVLFEKKSEKDKLTKVPYNAFSPDNKYLMLEDEVEGIVDFIVFRTDGKDIKPDTKFVRVIELFNFKYPEFVVTDVTGWAGPSLIVVNADYKEGGVGPTFWFDLSNFTFIRLGGRFN